MDIISAIKSGKPFKRPVHKYWYSDDSGTLKIIVSDNKMDTAYFYTIDLKSDDWEIQEKTITITESQLIDACRKYDVYTQYSKFKKELGF